MLALKADPKGSLAGYYDLPGGRIDDDEFYTPLTDIIKREVLEEIGEVKINLNPKPVAVGRHLISPSKLFGKVNEKDIHILYLFFEAEYQSGDIEISDEHQSFEWISLTDIKNNAEHYFTSGILEGIQMYCTLYEDRPRRDGGPQEKNMGYLGEGFYYKVYETDKGRVFKKFQPYWFSFKKIYDFSRKRAGSSIIKSIKDAHRARTNEKRALLTMKEKLQRMPLHLFANPHFVAGRLDYYQDEVEILDDFLQRNDLETNKRVIDKYIELQKTFWSHGFHDKTFKLQTNYGVNKNGEVVCVDFGECAFTKEKTQQSILSKKMAFSRLI